MVSQAAVAALGDNLTGAGDDLRNRDHVGRQGLTRTLPQTRQRFCVGFPKRSLERPTVHPPQELSHLLPIHLSAMQQAYLAGGLFIFSQTASGIPRCAKDNSTIGP